MSSASGPTGPTGPMRPTGSNGLQGPGGPGGPQAQQGPQIGETMHQMLEKYPIEQVLAHLLVRIEKLES